MASVITADNGTVSGSAGIKSSADSSGVLALATGSGTTAVTIDASQNVGIGTASPSNLLTLNKASGNYGVSISTNGYGTLADFGVVNAGTDNTTYVGSVSNNPFKIKVYNQYIATFDTSGNLGLGVTPSAWTSFRAIDIGTTGAVTSFSSSPDIQLDSNCFYNGSWIYKTTNTAGRFRVAGNAFEWHNAASGTAGNAITFTQAMTLDASGNLSIGATSNGNGYGVYVKKSSTNSASVAIENNNGGWSIATSSNELTFNQFNIGERARIDSSGNLLVGGTTAGAKVRIETNLAPQDGLDIKNTVNNTGNTFVAFLNSANGVAGSITQPTATTVAYNVTSDQRLKENIEDAEPASDLIDSIQVRQYDWKSDGSHQRYGFIAQELALVAPEAVHQPNEPDKTWGVDYSKLVPMLVKEIQSLRVRLAALEAK